MASKKDKNYYSKGGRGGRAEVVSGPLAGEYKLPEEEKEMRDAVSAARKAVSAEDQASGLKGRRLADRKEKREAAGPTEALASNEERKKKLVSEGAWRTSPLLSSGEDTVATKKDTKKPTAKKKNATDAAVERMNETAEKEKAKPKSKKPGANKKTPTPKSTPVVNDDGGMPKGKGTPTSGPVVNDDSALAGKGSTVPPQVPRSDSSGNTVDLNRFTKKPEAKKTTPGYDKLTPEQKTEYDDLAAQGYREISPRKSESSEDVGVITYGSSDEDSAPDTSSPKPRGDGRRFILNTDKSGKSEPVYGTAEEAKANAERIRKLRDMKETGSRDTTPKPQSAPASEPVSAPEAEPTKPSFGSRIRGWISGSGGKGGAPTAGAGAPPSPPRPTSGSGGGTPPPPPPGGGYVTPGAGFPPPTPPTGGGAGGSTPPSGGSGGGGGNTYAPQNTSKNYNRSMNGAVINDTSSNNAFQGNNNTFGNNSFNAGNIGGGGMAISTGGNATTDGPGMAVSTGGNAHVRGHNATRQGRPTTNNPRTQQP
jgi:hypothetical protein